MLFEIKVGDSISTIQPTSSDADVIFSKSASRCSSVSVLESE